MKSGKELASSLLSSTLICLQQKKRAVDIRMCPVHDGLKGGLRPKKVCCPIVPLPPARGQNEKSFKRNVPQASAGCISSVFVLPKREVPSSGNLESMATCPLEKWSGILSKCA